MSVEPTNNNCASLSSANSTTSSTSSGVVAATTAAPVNANNTQSIADYLAQLLKDKKQLAAFPNVFLHVERLLDDGKHDDVIRPARSALNLNGEKEKKVHPTYYVRRMGKEKAT